MTIVFIKRIFLVIKSIIFLHFVTNFFMYLSYIFKNKDKYKVQSPPSWPELRFIRVIFFSTSGKIQNKKNVDYKWICIYFHKGWIQSVSRSEYPARRNEMSPRKIRDIMFLMIKSAIPPPLSSELYNVYLSTNCIVQNIKKRLKDANRFR